MECAPDWLDTVTYRDMTNVVRANDTRTHIHIHTHTHTGNDEFPAMKVQVYHDYRP